MNGIRKLSLVTALTLIRLPLALLFLAGATIYAMYPELFPDLFTFSLLCVIAAPITDLLDGLLARKFGVATKLGSHTHPAHKL